MLTFTTARFTVVGAAVIAAAIVGATAALAGAKPTSAYDPLHHTAAAARTIDISGARWLHTRRPLPPAGPALGRGTLNDRLRASSPQCRMLHLCVYTRPVRFKLTRPIACPRQDIFGSVYSRLYVGRIGGTGWRELHRYHAVVRADCG